jgi:hypothetical protein
MILVIRHLAVGADPRSFHAIDWGVYGVPETFLIDGDGTILLRMAPGAARIDQPVCAYT